jgi:SAM-dependent methyltransferase
MITQQLLSKLLCINCLSQPPNFKLIPYEMKGKKIINGKIKCNICGKNFPIEKGVPLLIAKEKINSEKCKVWEDHLRGLENRRESNFKRIIKVTKATRKYTNQNFFDFIEIMEGDWLDLGCGPGKLRHYVTQNKVIYYGLDPLPDPLCKDFFYVQAITEQIPFQNDIFDNITAISALDHFADLDLAFEEIRRVLKPAGRFHISQSVNEITSPIAAIKTLGHLVKDSLEMRNLKNQRFDAVKHIMNFTQKSLIEILSSHFKVEKMNLFSPKWYVPYKVFLTASPK